MDSREERIGLNEALFRQVNERLKDVNEGFGIVDEQSDFVCECGDLDCTARISMPLSEYQRIRAQSDLFAVVPGHETANVERIVERREGYDVVQKRAGTPTRVAEQTDPRS